MLQMMETIKKEKTQHWEKISANDITDKGFVCGLYKELITTKKSIKKVSTFTLHILYIYIYIYIKSWVHTDNSNSKSTTKF